MYHHSNNSADMDNVIIQTYNKPTKLNNQVQNIHVDRCTICTLLIFHNKAYLKTCNHIYHYDCILQWSNKSNTCMLQSNAICTILQTFMLMY